MAKLSVYYDPEIIQTAANKYYNAATTIIMLSSLFGLILGAVIGLAIIHFVKSISPNEMLVFLVSCLVCFFIGYANGNDRAFRLKYEAQKALCQVQIEKNTRVHVEETL